MYLLTCHLIVSLTLGTFLGRNDWQIVKWGGAQVGISDEFELQSMSLHFSTLTLEPSSLASHDKEMTTFNSQFHGEA
jgi:hypothetical protein